MHWRAVRDLAGDLDRRVEARFSMFIIDERFEENVVAPVLVDQRRARLARLQHVVHRRQFLVVDLDRSGDVLGFGARVGATHIATSSPTWRTLSVASTGCSETLKPGKPETARIGFTPVEIGGGEDAVLVLRRDRYAADARMRQRAADERHVPHAGKADVGDELAAAAHQAVVFLAQETRAYSLFRHTNSLDSGEKSTLPNSSYF